VQPRNDGSFVVRDAHGIVAGPYGSRTVAFAAALRLPRPPVPRGRAAQAAFRRLFKVVVPRERRT
jgi:hypothetical protein